MRNTYYCVTDYATDKQDFYELRSMAEEAYSLIEGHKRLERVNIQHGTATLIKEAA